MTRGGYVLVTGGAGFIGANLAHRLLASHERVAILDDLSRKGAEANLAWLEERYPGDVAVFVGDVRDPAAVDRAVVGATFVFHLAAQTGSTAAVDDPVRDFDVNARGTLNVLEAVRRRPAPPPFAFASTGKVYGPLADVPMTRRGSRYQPSEVGLVECGVSEDRPLDVHGPHGCSKGAADRYVLDYAATFALPAVVLRIGTVYGPRQFGSDDAGWVANFLQRALRRRGITIYGDGMQVRDLLFVDDLVDALVAVRMRGRELAGNVYNVGGGPPNTTSLLEVLEVVEQLEGRRPEITFRSWRPGDRRYYATDARRFADRTGWRPRIGVNEGLRRTHKWLVEALAEPSLAAAFDIAAER